MKLSDLRPCDSCGGKIAPIFYIVKSNIALIDARAANRILGLNQMFGGGAPGLAKVFSPDGDEVTKGDPKLETELFLCATCYCERLCIAQLVEHRSEALGRFEELPAPEGAK